MNTILVIDSAVSGDASVSKALVREAVAALTADAPADVVYRDLGRDPVPHLTEATLAGVRGEPKTEAERAARALSDALIAELRAADTIVIGAPMYNFSVADRAARLVRLRAARRRDLPLLRGRARGPARRQAGHRRREPRRPLQRGPGAGDRLPGALPAAPARLHRPDRRDLRARREDRLRPRGARPPRSPRRPRASRRPPRAFAQAA